MKTEFEAINAPLRAYAYTIKSLGSELEADYEPFFKKLDYFKITVEYKIKEFDKSGKSHYHGILYLPKGFFRKRIILKGFHLKLEELYNKAGWIRYIHKDIKWEDYEDMEPPEQDDLIEMPTKRLF
jgi:hypothetical protein